MQSKSTMADFKFKSNLQSQSSSIEVQLPNSIWNSKDYHDSNINVTSVYLILNLLYSIPLINSGS